MELVLLQGTVFQGLIAVFATSGRVFYTCRVKEGHRNLPGMFMAKRGLEGDHSRNHIVALGFFSLVLAAARFFE